MIESTSTAELKADICTWDNADLYELIRLLRSKVCARSKRLAECYQQLSKIPAAGTEARGTAASEVIHLLGWYGSNAFAYWWRKRSRGVGGKPYLGILGDVARTVNKSLPREQRHSFPVSPGVADLEQELVGMMVGLQFSKKKREEVIQILTESGLERNAAHEVAERYGSIGLAGAGLPILVRILGKKTVMVMMQQILVGIVGRFIGRKAAMQMAKRLAVKIAQKTLSRLIAFVGWVLLATDLVLFMVAPARRILVTSVPFIAIQRECQRLETREPSGRLQGG